MPYSAPADNIVGEIVRATTIEFVAHCPDKYLYDPPRFGAFVKTPHTLVSPSAPLETQTETQEEEDPFAEAVPVRARLSEGDAEGTIYAVVCYAETLSAEPGRNPSPFGMLADTLAKEHPQLPELLSTEFSALHLGFAQKGRFRPYLPPKPARLHAFVSYCTREEIIAITETPDYLRTLLNFTATAGSDELIAASVRAAFEARENDFEYLVSSGKQLASLLRDSPDRLSALLRKLDPEG